jgi:hypothetical protein
MTLREALVILDLSERTLEPSMLNISLKNRLEKTELRNVTRVLEAYRKVNSFLNPTLDTQGDSKGTVIDEPIEDGPPIQTTRPTIPTVKSETGLRRDYAPVSTPNPTLLGASGHYEAGNTTVMIDPSDTPHQQIDPRQTSIIIDDLNDGFQVPAPRAGSRQLAPLAIVGLGLLAFAGGLGGMAVVSKLLTPPAIVATSGTDPIDPNTVAIAKPNNSNTSNIQDPNSNSNLKPVNTSPTASVDPSSSNPNPTPVVKPSQAEQTKPSGAVTVKPQTNQKPANTTTTVKTPEIAAQAVKPTIPQAAPVKPNNNAQAILERQKAQTKAIALEKARQERLEKLRLAQVEKTRQGQLEKARLSQLEKARQERLEKARLAQLEKARLEALKAARVKERQAELEQARLKESKVAREKARLAQLEQARIDARNKLSLDARNKARIDARNKARIEVRIKAATQARNAKALERAKARAEQRARDAAAAKARAQANIQAQAKARAQAQARIRSQSQTVVNSSARNLNVNRSQFYAWDRNGAVLRYGSWSQIPQSIKTARSGTFRASVFVASSPAAMPDIRR